MLTTWLVPWEFSWTFLACFGAAAALYLRGVARMRVSFARQLTFWTGMLLTYGSLHTYFDYYAEHEFFIHRIQQVLLHHLAPLLIMASYPGSVMRRGLPLAWRVRLRALQRSRSWRAATAVLLHPAVVSMVFVGLILLWLIPHMQTLAMIDWRLYRLMNWSMMVSGLVYWWMVLDHRPAPPGRMRPGLRVLSPAFTMSPQIVAGAIVTFTSYDLYPIFEICGRALTIDVITGQQLGGAIMWVPAAFVEVAGALLAFRQWMRLSRTARLRDPRLARPLPAA
ncbi:cytochrome c oxidase assembly protein [Coralloluteibacterium stylophorae]|uniref:Cytochrome c oxidase assembly protein n=1 Tax=Coralloluteibacterium stylophorae TaxID=1776034 RepID=A0A8J7VSG4_9GAMM|nr:cytochrome c oxidase assembly protein [Coralloluteibacterium stylophorae]MBS7457013.1 cytochrome c oxidase assembly protein [Coralloluteibacterium stylophorae]